MKLRILKLLAMAIFFMTAFVQAGSIPVANNSFEDPVVPFAEPYALPDVNDWIELDMDPLGYSQNTGVFLNVTSIANTDGGQLAFLGGEKGNALLQDLSAVYQVGKSYKLTAGVCVSAQFPPYDPNGLQFAFYYQESNDPNRIDIVSATTLGPSSFTSTTLEDNSIYLSTVQADDAWAGKAIGIAIRATGPMGGYWDVDNVRVTEYPLVPNFTDDSIVNLAEFAKMAADWLYCDDPVTDVTGEGCVNEDDLLILMEYWLDNV
ncbi:MAG: hypothetical protein ACYS72_07025 [Planctomycetota bacterium]|jgi:hypothetical protein